MEFWQLLGVDTAAHRQGHGAGIDGTNDPEHRALEATATLRIAICAPLVSCCDISTKLAVGANAREDCSRNFASSCDRMIRMRAVSEPSFQLIVETIPGLVAVMTATGEVEHVNRQVLEYFRRTLDELKQWGTSDAVHPADLPRVTAAWQHAV